MTIINQSILSNASETLEGRGSNGDTYEQQNHQDIMKIVIPKQFQEDVKALCDHAEIEGLTPGMTIKMSLQEILGIIPKQRKRMDSYKTLVAYLKEEMNITLELSSRKNKTA